MIGALCGGATGLAFWGTEGWWILPLMALAGALGGFAWAMIPAILKIRFNANEILVSLMLVYVAELLLSALVSGPLRDPDGFNFPESRMFHDSATVPIILENTRAIWVCWWPWGSAFWAMLSCIGMPSGIRCA